MTRSEVYTLIRTAITNAGSQKAFAQQAGVSPQYICDIVNGRLDPADKILKAVGVRKKIVYEEIGK
jgi:predicted transcriptional regulator